MTTRAMLNITNSDCDYSKNIAIFCLNMLGGCTQILSSDLLIKAASDPAKIKCIKAIRPRDAWKKPEHEIIEKAVVKFCENCQIIWPKGDWNGCKYIR